MACSLVVGFWFAIAGGSEGLGASRRGMAGERWVAETWEPRRSLNGSIEWEMRPVVSFASPRFEDRVGLGAGGMTSSCHVKPR